MNQFLRTIVLGTLLAASGMSAASAAGAADPVVGTWTLNVAKSKFSSGHGLKSETRTYAETADGTTLTVSGVAEDGTTISQNATWKYDGKDYPVTGFAGADTIALKKVNGSTVASTLKMHGKAVASTVRTISGHGKMLTLTTKQRDEKGHNHTDVSVFDKQ